MVVMQGAGCCVGSVAGVGTPGKIMFDQIYRKYTQKVGKSCVG